METLKVSPCCWLSRMELFVTKELGCALRRKGKFRDPLDFLHVSDEHLLWYYRFPREELESTIGRPTRKSHDLPVMTQVLIALRFYPSGTFQSAVGDTTSVHQSSASRAIDGDTEVLYRNWLREIYMPSRLKERTTTTEKFARKSNIFKVIGAVDCTHVVMKTHSETEHLYVNRKNYHSLNSCLWQPNLPFLIENGLC